MKKNTLTQLMGLLIMAVALSVGFYYNLGDDHSKTTPDANSRGDIINLTYSGDAIGSWTQGAPIPIAAMAGGFASFQVNDTGWVFAVGGDRDFAGTVNNNTQKYNINTNTWTQMAVYPTNIEYTAGANLADFIYIAGGMTSSYFSTEVSVVYKYNVNANTWTTVTSLPQILAGNKAVGYQDSLIYCLGGFNAGGSTSTNIVYLYNAISGVWRTASSLPAALCIGACSISGDTIVYIGGGSTYFGSYSNSTYKGLISQSDRSVITWTIGLAYPGTGRWRFDAAKWGCKGIIMGAGTNVTFGTGNECYVYSPGNNTWTSQPPQPNNSTQAQLGSFNRSDNVGKFIVVGGEQYPASPYVITNTQIYTDTAGCGPTVNNICEGFISTTFPPTGWAVVYTGALYWMRRTQSGFGLGVGCAYYDMWNAPTGTNQDLITPVFQPSNPGDSIKFDIAYCAFGTINDQLAIYGSTNSGLSYTLIHLLPATEMITVASCTHPFVPLSSDWGRRAYPISTGTNRLKFTGMSAFGDGVYLDSICKPYPTGIKMPIEGQPKLFSLFQNYPNPFNPKTIINYSLPRSGKVVVKVYDVLGKEVATIVNEFKQAGNYSVVFDASDLPSGVYFYQLIISDSEKNSELIFSNTKKLVLLK